MDDFPKLLIVLGISLALVGVLWLGAVRIFGSGAQLPGNFVLQTENLTCLVPLGLSILLSIVLTVILNLVIRAMGK